jgi:hypothetical protein
MAAEPQTGSVCCPGPEVFQLQLSIYGNRQVLMIGNIPVGGFRFIKINAFYSNIIFPENFSDNSFNSIIKNQMSDIGNFL